MAGYLQHYPRSNDIVVQTVSDPCNKNLSRNNTGLSPANGWYSDEIAACVSDNE